MATGYDRSTQRRTAQRRRPSERSSQSARLKARKRKTNLAVFYVATLIVGVVVAVFLFAMAFQTIGDTISLPSPAQQAQEPVVTEVVRPGRDRAFGMVTATNTSSPRTVTLHLIETGRTQRFNMTEATAVLDRFGTAIAFGEVNMGQIVDILYDAASGDMSELSLSGQAWEQQHRGNLNINPEAGTITIGNQTHTYSSQTLVLNRGEPFSVAQINSEDAVTLVGYGNKIWSIRLDGGHGSIRFENADRVLNGRVTVGNSILTGLDGTRPISVIEGTHRIIVEGANIENFLADVVVRQGETSVVNLLDVTFRQGTLQLNINEPDATIILNGEVVELENGRMEMDFGIHILRVEKTGFTPVQEEFEFNQPFMRMDLELSQDRNLLHQILIETFPSDAQVFLDDALVGNSPTVVEVGAGHFHVVLRRAGYEERHFPLTVDEASPRQYLLHLVQQQTQLPPVDNNQGAAAPGDLLPPLPEDWAPVPSPGIPDWNLTESDSPLIPPAVPDNWPPAAEDMPLPPPDNVPLPPLPPPDDIPLPPLPEPGGGFDDWPDSDLGGFDDWPDSEWGGFDDWLDIPTHDDLWALPEGN